MPPQEPPPTPPRTTTCTSLPNIVLASALCSASIIEFTIPQIVRLSQSSAAPLPTIPFPRRMLLMAKNLPPQTLITVVQFGLVREMRDVLDATLGPSPFNISLAYGAASVPLIAAKYNLLQESVFRQTNNATKQHRATATTTSSSLPAQALAFWSRKIQPGLLWSYLRDSGSIGGGIVLGPLVTSHVVHRVLDVSHNDSTPVHRFFGGLLAGCCTGLGTQLFHNAALTAGRIAQVEHRVPSTLECLRSVVQEHGASALWMNFRMRVMVIASWTAILNVTEPFGI
jgi:hypothetical protein